VVKGWKVLSLPEGLGFEWTILWHMLVERRFMINP